MILLKAELLGDANNNKKSTIFSCYFKSKSVDKERENDNES